MTIQDCVKSGELCPSKEEISANTYLNRQFLSDSALYPIVSLFGNMLLENGCKDISLRGSTLDNMILGNSNGNVVKNEGYRNLIASTLDFRQINYDFLNPVYITSDMVINNTNYILKTNSPVMYDINGFINVLTNLGYTVLTIEDGEILIPVVLQNGNSANVLIRQFQYKKYGASRYILDLVLGDFNRESYHICERVDFSEYGKDKLFARDISYGSVDSWSSSCVTGGQFAPLPKESDYHKLRDNSINSFKSILETMRKDLNIIANCELVKTLEKTIESKEINGLTKEACMEITELRRYLEYILMTYLREYRKQVVVGINPVLSDIHDNIPEFVANWLIVGHDTAFAEYTARKADDTLSEKLVVDSGVRYPVGRVLEKMALELTFLAMIDPNQTVRFLQESGIIKLIEGVRDDGKYLYSGNDPEEIRKHLQTMKKQNKLHHLRFVFAHGTGANIVVN